MPARRGRAAGARAPPRRPRRPGPGAGRLRPAPGEGLNAALFVLLAALWGGSFVAIKFVVAELPPFLGVVLRLALSAATLAAALPPLGRPLTVPKSLRPKTWLAGVFSVGLPFCLLFWGEQRIPAGLAGILNGTMPLWTFLLSWLFLKEHEPVTARSAAGLALGLAGVVAIFAPRLEGGLGSASFLGTLAVTGMAACYAVGTVLNRILLSKSVSLTGVLLEQNLGGLAFAAAAMLVVEGIPAAPRVSGSALAALLYLSVLANALAWLVYFHLLRQWGAVRTSAVGYLVPVAAVLGDRVVFGALPGGWELAGMAAILSGVGLLHLGKRRKKGDGLPPPPVPAAGGRG